MILTNLNAKKLRELNKKGYTPEDIAMFYQCTKEELKNQVFRVYHKNEKTASEPWNSLESNHKIARKKAPEVLEISEIPETTEDSNTLESSEAQETLPILVAPAPEPTAQPAQPSLFDSLKAEEKTMSDELLSLEKEHEALAAHKRACIRDLRDYEKRLEQLLSQLNSLSNQQTITEQEAIDTVDKMKDVNIRIRSKKTALEEVRNKIDSVKYDLYIYADGTLFSDNEAMLKQDEGYLELSWKLYARPECVYLRICDIVALARTLKIAERVEKLNPIFGLNTVEAAFEQLKTVDFS